MQNRLNSITSFFKNINKYKFGTFLPEKAINALSFVG